MITQTQQIAFLQKPCRLRSPIYLGKQEKQRTWRRTGLRKEMLKSRERGFTKIAFDINSSIVAEKVS
jgi:hypothetical protein